MASKRIKYARVLRYSEEFTAGLSSAILEWFLIFLLFLNALFSYLVTKFSRSCKLKTPCLLCSRLDHVFGNEKPGFYKDLICGAHKLEVSSLVFCCVHDRLADAHEMCDSCLFSSVIEKKSNSKTYGLLLAKLGPGHDNFVDKNLLYESSRLDSSNETHCSCCTELWKPKPFVHRLFPKKSIDSDFGKFDFHLPESVGYSGLKPFDGLKKKRTYLGGCGIDPLSNVGYRELKITSDSDSEVPLSDDDDTSYLTHDMNNLKEESVPQFVQPESHTIASDTLLNPSDGVSVPNKLIDQVPKPVTSLSIDHEQLDVVEPHHVTSSASDSVAAYNVERLKPCDQKAYPPALLDLISLHDEPSASNIDGVVTEVSWANFDVMGTGDLVGTSKSERGVCMPKTGLSIVQYSDKNDIVEGAGETFHALRTDDVQQISSSGSGDTCQSDGLLTTVSGSGLKRDQAVNNPSPSLVSLLGLSEVYKLHVGNKGDQASSMFSENHTAKRPKKVNEDLRVIIPQRPASRGSDLSASDTSPRWRGLHDQLKVLDGSSSIDLDTLQKRILIERNESVFDSLDGIIVSEIEGESELDCMKRQFEYDRKCMSALFKELDEERNASAIAANQAMAMITRLQEEKAALHMEALQYLRMMEEQAEYDMEALQKANDLLAEREKEIQDLEADLDYYRIKYPEEEDAPEPCEYKVENNRVDHLNLRCSENGTNGGCHTLSTKKSEDSSTPEKNDAGSSSYHTSIAEDSLLNFEDERLYILQCLKKMEKKLKLQNNEVHMDMCNGVYTEKEDGLSDIEQDHDNMVMNGRTLKEEYSSFHQNDSNLFGGVPPTEDRSNTSSCEPQFTSQGNGHFDGLDASVASTTTHIISIESEILDLNERLETLEADRDFLEHAISSLQNGREGVRFLQEIAHHLYELRNMGIKRREKGVA